MRIEIPRRRVQSRLFFWVVVNVLPSSLGVSHPPAFSCKRTASVCYYYALTNVNTHHLTR